MGHSDTYYMNAFRHDSYKLYMDIANNSLDYGFSHISLMLVCVARLNQGIEFFDYEHAYKDMELDELLECWHEYTEKAIKDNDFIFFIRLVYYVIGSLDRLDEYINMLISSGTVDGFKIKED